MTNRDERTQRGERTQRLERLMHRALRELPSRRAPSTLEERVLREIGRRTSRSSHQSGFARWPPAARAALLAICCVSVVVVLLGAKPLAAHLAALPLEPAIAARLEGLREIGMLVASLGTVASELLRMIPPEWVLGGWLATALLYALLFALIAVGYSTLYAAPERSGARPI